MTFKLYKPLTVILDFKQLPQQYFEQLYVDSTMQFSSLAQRPSSSPPSQCMDFKTSHAACEVWDV